MFSRSQVKELPSRSLWSGWRTARQLSEDSAPGAASSPSQLPAQGLRASLSTHILLRLWLSRKEGVGSKPRKLLSPETKIHGFSSWCSESSSLKKPQQTPSQHETAKVNEREKACLVLSMCPFLDGIALCYCLCKQMWKACNWNRENRGRETWERKQFHQGRVGSQWQSKN